MRSTTAAIGAVIGHEMGHGFDDQGRQFDGAGVMRDWWTEKDGAEFKKRTARLVEQFGAYEVLPGLKVNGELTLGENIGDLTGLVIGHRAYLLALGGKPAPVIDGLTGEQRFFIGWAQCWRREDPRGCAATAGPVERAPAGAVPRERPARQHPGVLHGVRGEAGRPVVHRARQARANLVRPPP